MGEVEKALSHYNQAGKYTETKHIEQVEDVIKCLKRCEEARRSKEWNVVLKETCFVISYGADSSPRVSFLSCSFHIECFCINNEPKAVLALIKPMIVNLKVYALQTEALLHLQRQEEANDVYQKATKRLDIDCFIKIFGLSITSYILMVGAQVYIAAGRSVVLLTHHMPCRLFHFFFKEKKMQLHILRRVHHRCSISFK